MENKLKFKDLIPAYGVINFIYRSTYDLMEETPSIRELVVRGINSLLLIGYNATLLTGIIKLSGIEDLIG